MIPDWIKTNTVLHEVFSLGNSLVIHRFFETPEKADAYHAANGGVRTSRKWGGPALRSLTLELFQDRTRDRGDRDESDVLVRGYNTEAEAAPSPYGRCSVDTAFL